VSEHGDPAPPAGEQVHLPGPTILPFAMAIGITLIVVGTTVTWFLSIIGGIIFIWTLIRWVRDTRRDVSELPDEH
jgi:Flp pilus assembly protein TadB